MYGFVKRPSTTALSPYVVSRGYLKVSEDVLCPYVVVHVSPRVMETAVAVDQQRVPHVAPHTRRPLS